MCDHCSLPCLLIKSFTLLNLHNHTVCPECMSAKDQVRATGATGVGGFGASCCSWMGCRCPRAVVAAAGVCVCVGGVSATSTGVGTACVPKTSSQGDQYESPGRAPAAGQVGCWASAVQAVVATSLSRDYKERRSCAWDSCLLPWGWGEGHAGCYTFCSSFKENKHLLCSPSLPLEEVWTPSEAVLLHKSWMSKEHHRGKRYLNLNNHIDLVIAATALWEEDSQMQSTER